MRSRRIRWLAAGVACMVLAGTMAATGAAKPAVESAASAAASLKKALKLGKSADKRSKNALKIAKRADKRAAAADGKAGPPGRPARRAPPGRTGRPGRTEPGAPSARPVLRVRPEPPVRRARLGSGRSSRRPAAARISSWNRRGPRPARERHLLCLVRPDRHHWLCLHRHGRQHHQPEIRRRSTRRFSSGTGQPTDLVRAGPSIEAGDLTDPGSGNGFHVAVLC